MATKNGVSGAVVAVAGRRIDAPDATRPRFPLDRVPAVLQALRAQLIEV